MLMKVFDTLPSVRLSDESYEECEEADYVLDLLESSYDASIAI